MQLFDLNRDKAEQNNLFTKKPKKVKELLELLER